MGVWQSNLQLSIKLFGVSAITLHTTSYVGSGAVQSQYLETSIILKTFDWDPSQLGQ